MIWRHVEKSCDWSDLAPCTGTVKVAGISQEDKVVSGLTHGLQKACPEPLDRWEGARLHLGMETSKESVWGAQHNFKRTKAWIPVDAIDLDIPVADERMT